MFPTTLIIGLGGVGSRITTGIYKQFMDRNPSKDDKANFTCLCFDTDAGDIKNYLEVLPRENVVQTSSSESITIGQYINRIKDQTDVESWFDTSSDVIIKMKLNEGAGQVRMASRLAYMSAISEGKLNVIDRSIMELLKTDPARHEGNDIKVHIICSLAGGTGAGSFLQTAYYVKDVMRSLNIDAPKIIGYFVLGDVLCHDKEANLNGKQQENTRSNTYACMKELAAFTNRKGIQLIKDLDFEYKIGQEDKHLPTNDPYDLCYMIDFTNTDGTNIGDMKIYYDQVKDFVYMNAISPMGDKYRSKKINDTIQEIQTDGKGRFAAIGVSKMVFPVEDLYKYFAVQRLVDNLSSTWVTIDNNFKTEYEEYKKKQKEGIVTDVEPERGDYFVRNLAVKATSGSGIEGIEFKNIYESTQEKPQGEKSERFLMEIEKYINEEVVDKNPTFTANYNNCLFDGFGDGDDIDNDRETIINQEKKLRAFKDEAFRLIDSSRKGVITECFLQDAGQASYVSKDTSKTQHHLNTHILTPEKEMHPLAVRYFLYKVRDGIKSRLEGLGEEGGLKSANDNKYKEITEGYDNIYDVDDDKLSPNDHKENAPEALTIWYDKASFFNKKELKTFKEDYLTNANAQRENIKEYTKKRLLQYVLEGLQDQIRQLIEESEGFFLRLPDTIRNLQNQCNDLLEKHEGNADPTSKYVLAAKDIKEGLYEEDIKKTDSLFFPPDISARIYRTMFENTKMALEQNTSLGKLKDDEEAAEAKEKKLIEANNKLFDGVIGQQIKVMKKTSPQYMEMNILQALKKEGELRKSTSEEVFTYMKSKIKELGEMAVIRGAYNITTNPFSRYMNSWGINNFNGILDNEKDNLFLPNNAQAEDKADCEANHFYSQYELVRVNSVSLLKLEENFKGFTKVKADDKQDGHVGSYLKAYQDINNRILAGEPDFSRHLDKHWQLPAYMPNIGETMDDITNNIFKALYYGLLFDKFSVVNNSGEDYWYYKGNNPKYISDFNGYFVSFGQSANLEAGLNELFERGLIDNPSMVDYINECVIEEWKAAKTEWQRTPRPAGTDVLDLMKQHTLIKKMMSEFNYGDIYNKWSGHNWFSFLSCSNNTVLSRTINNLKKKCFNDLMDHILDIFEPSTNTYNLCETMFETIPDNMMKEAALTELEQYKNSKKFALRNPTR